MRCVRHSASLLAALSLSAVLLPGPGQLPADTDGNPAESTPRSQPTSAEPEKITPDRSAYEQTVAPFLKTYCSDCHGAVIQESDLRLDKLALDFTDVSTAGRWLKVRKRLDLGQMPPEDASRHPKANEVARVVAWIEGRLERAQAQLEAQTPPRMMRRLTRREYTNTMEDLLHYRFLPDDSPLQTLPQDGQVHGFHRLGQALPLDPSLMEKYYEIAKKAADELLVDGEPEYPTERTRFEYEDTRKSRAIDYQIAHPSFLVRGDYVVLMEGGARAFHKLDYPGTNTMVPVEGWYKVRVRAAAKPGEDGDPVKMWVERPKTNFRREVVVDASPDDFRTYEWLVPMTPRGGNVVKAGIVDGTKFYHYNRDHSDYRNTIREAGKNQEYRKVLLTRAREWAEGVSGGGVPRKETIDRSKLPQLLLDYIEVEGPVHESWPPRLHQELFTHGTDSAEPDYIHNMLERFMRRAYRRPVTDEEVAVIRRVVDSELEHGASLVEAMRVGIAAVLSSPQFLYLSEPADGDGELTHWQIASRLSYFLWSTMPDETLFRLAEEGRLHEPAVLERQVERMLDDPRGQALVDGFGAQWLKTGDFRKFNPDEELYPEYNEELGAAMVREAEAFFERILFEDKRVLNFIDSDWTMLNERLATFYGIEGVAGEEFRPVELPDDSPRGGVLTMAGVAMWGSDGTRTRPINRAKYVRDVLFNDPPEPPPGNVGELEPAVEGEDLTVRERLAQHRSLEQCMKCHRRLDPYGMALENFNVIGRWRDRQDGESYEKMPRKKRPKIDASATLPGGVEYEGPAEFKRALMTQKDRFLRGLSQKMLIYALGRPVEPSDYLLIDKLVQRMKNNGYTMRSLIKGLVTSRQFLTK